ncbi:MAG: porin family protein [Cyanothece sp. SIO2G6]|nr:porin family protein [Cyanothece sp. SIO2G6]
MRKVQRFGLAILTTVALPLMVTPVSAQPVQFDVTNDNQTGWYGSISPRASFGYDLDLESDDFEVGTTTVDSVDISVDTDTGFGINGAVGYQFEDARAELELGFGTNTVDDVTVDGTEVDADGRLNNWTLAANGYYDIPTGSAFRPYVGAGVGIARLVADDVSVDLPVLGGADLDDSGVSFIFQAQAGLAYDFTEDASAFVGYRLQGIPGQDFSVADIDLNADTVLIHSAQVGARYRF